MTIFTLALTLVFGTFIGSILNVIIHNIPRGETFTFTASYCEECNIKIRLYKLIPIISYLRSKGKCESCGRPISIRYPLLEMVTGIITLLTILSFGFSFEGFKVLGLIYWLIIIGIIDLDSTDIYTNTIISGVLLGISFIIITAISEGSLINAWSCLLGGLFGGGLIAIIVILTNGMGWGDVELFFMCGIFIGLKLTVLALLISFVIGAIVGVTLMLMKKKTRKDYIPFGPYIALAVILTVFYGNKIIDLYFSQF